MGALDEMPLLELPDREAWRAWLAANHGSSSGVWLAVGKKGGRVTSLGYEAAVEEALCFGWIDSIVRALDGDRFRQVFTPRRPGSTWSPSNKARVERLTAAGLMEPAGLAAVETARANGAWALLDDVEQLKVPEDLAAALAADPDAAREFEAFPASGRKQILWWIVSTKRPDTRANRVAETVRLAAKGIRVDEQRAAGRGQGA